MCAIFGSYNINKFIELAKLNSYRGQFSHSITAIDVENNEIRYMLKGFGEIKHLMPKEENIYYLGHTQAPTGGLIKDIYRVHPYFTGYGYLYHNGILKTSFMKKHEFNGWDTELLGDIFNPHDFSSLNDIDGSFSCAYIDSCYPNELLLFRNSTSPMFIDDDLNISSTKFDNSHSTEYNNKIILNLKDKTISCIKEAFNNKNTPYFLG